MQLAKLRILQNEKKLTKWKHDELYPYDKQSASRNSFLHEMQQIQKSPTKLAFASRTRGGKQNQQFWKIVYPHGGVNKIVLFMHTLS